MSTVQLTLDFSPGISGCYGSCREFVAARVHQLGLYMEQTGDTDPILYLADRYLRRADPDELRRRIAELEGQLAAAAGRAGR
jgi:hypothetical protein